MQLQGWSNLSLQTLETICMVQRHQSSSSSSHHCIKSVINWVVPEKIRTPPRRMGFWKFLWEVGSKALEMQAGGVLHLKKSSAGDISTDSSCNSNIQFGDTSAFSDPGNSRNILFTYFSPTCTCTCNIHVNDNLS